jgi:hypothetical protein
VYKKRALHWQSHYVTHSVKHAYFKKTGGYAIIQQFLGWVGGNAPPIRLKGGYVQDVLK